MSPRKGKYMAAKVYLLDDSVQVFHIPVSQVTKVKQEKDIFICDFLVATNYVFSGEQLDYTYYMYNV